MSATSFGGSFGLVKSNDSKIKHMFGDYLKQLALQAQFPFIKYLPFVPPPLNPYMDKVINDTVAKRRAQKGEGQKDLLQIFINTHEENPESYTEKNIHEEMILFM